MAVEVAAVVVAAGRGLRAGGDLPKQYRRILGEPVIRPSLAALAGHDGISAVQPVIHADDAALFQAAVAGLDLLPPVHGGASRQASVRAGLEALEASSPGPRAGARCRAAVCVGRPDHAGDRGRGHERRGGAGDRGRRHRQNRRCDRLRDRHDRPSAICAWCRRRRRSALPPCSMRISAPPRQGRDDFTDDAALAEWAGLKVTTFEGEAGNVKLTTRR